MELSKRSQYLFSVQPPMRDPHSEDMGTPRCFERTPTLMFQPISPMGEAHTAPPSPSAKELRRKPSKSNLIVEAGISGFIPTSYKIKTFFPNISHTVYNPFSSTTAEPSRQISFMQYGSGQMVGVVFHDTVTLAAIEVKQQLVEAALETDNLLAPTNFPCDRIFGLYALGNTTVKPGANQMVLHARQ
jgi:hypothetical protein